VAYKTMLFEERGRFLVVSVGLPELADDALRKRIRSGFSSTIVVSMVLYREGQGKPLGLTLRTYRVLYDLWDELWLLKMQDPQGELNQRLGSEAEALAKLTQIQSLPLTPLDQVPRGIRHYLAIYVEVNPISPEHLAQVRRWLAHPGGAERLSGETFLGSF